LFGRVIQTYGDSAFSHHALMAWVLAAEEHYPRYFYAAAFLVSYENSTMFDDLRGLVRVTMHALHAGGHSGIDEGHALFIVAGGILVLGAIIAGVLMLQQRRRGVVAELRRPS
jgi:hypothetical protein